MKIEYKMLWEEYLAARREKNWRWIKGEPPTKYLRAQKVFLGALTSSLGLVALSALYLAVLVNVLWSIGVIAAGYLAYASWRLGKTPTQRRIRKDWKRSGMDNTTNVFDASETGFYIETPLGWWKIRWKAAVVRENESMFTFAAHLDTLYVPKRVLSSAQGEEVRKWATQKLGEDQKAQESKGSTELP